MFNEFELSDLPVGSVVVAVDRLGPDSELVVERTYENVKNGEPGFDAHYVADPTNLTWRYMSQVVRIVRKP